jgi:hypothetical protein
MARDESEVMVVPVVGLVLSVLGGRLECGVRHSVLCWWIWQESASVTVKMFSHLIYFKKSVINLVL